MIEALQNSSAPLLDMILAAVLILVALSLSKFLKLGLEKDLFIAALRTTVQLILIGFVLRTILSSESWSLNFLALIIMTLAAAQALTSRLKSEKRRAYMMGLGVLMLSVWPLGYVSIFWLFREKGLIQSALFIPFMGVLLGNTLAAISLAFLHLEKINSNHLLEIETLKALGATPWESTRRLYREVIRNAMTPILNGMTIVGLVSLPGVMAGQLLGGVDALTAARFQILIMFLMALVSLLGSWLAIVFHHYKAMPAWFDSSPPLRHFTANEHEILGLMGPSGIGKSRLLKSLVGLDINTPLEGKVSDSLPLYQDPSKSTYYLSQNAYWSPETVEENLQLPFQFQKHHNKNYDRSFVLDLLKRFDIHPKILQQPSHTLSGGESQILHLIRTLQLQPEVLMLDEPTASLDLDRTIRVENFLKEWVLKNKSVVLISHSAEQIQRLADRIFHFREDRIEVLESQTLSPFTR